jgi:hypothetical protein
MDSLDGLKGKMEKSTGRYRRLEALLVHLREVSSDVDDLSVELEEAKERLEKSMGSVCPLCGGVLVAEEKSNV